MNKKGKFIHNLFYAFLAQGVSLLLSIFTSFLIPRLLGIEDFSYWQLFLFYISYVGFFHFGLNDGVYLKYGGMNYENLNYSLLSGCFKIEIIMQIVIAIVINFAVFLFINETDRNFVFFMMTLYMIVFNLSLYLGYVFQATNLTKLYSLSVIIDKLIFMVATIVLLLFRYTSFEIYIIWFLIAKLFCFLYCIYQGRSVIFCKVVSWKLAMIEFFNNICIGVNLMIAALSSMLILGIGRFFIDAYWGIEVFGKIAFSLTLSSFVLAFIAQIGMVLYPMLRQSNEGEQKALYMDIKSALSVILPIVYILYAPVREVLNLWLPKYTESIQFLSILLPICIFDGKMNLLCNTFFKVLRRERYLLKINLVTVILSIILSFVGVFILENVFFVIIGMVISIVFRSVVSEMFLCHLMDVKLDSTLLQEIAMTIIFMFVAWSYNSYMLFCIMLVLYSLYLLKNKELLKVFSIFRKGK